MNKMIKKKGETRITTRAACLKSSTYLSGFVSLLVVHGSITIDIIGLFVEVELGNFRIDYCRKEE